MNCYKLANSRNSYSQQSLVKILTNRICFDFDLDFFFTFSTICLNIFIYLNVTQSGW